MSVKTAGKPDEDEEEDVPMSTLDLLSKSVVIQQTNRATIPKDVREVLGVDVGDEVEFIISGDGSVRIEPCE